MLSIHDYAFRFNNSISSIVLKNAHGDMALGMDAFSDSALREVSIDISSANGSD